MKATKTLLLCLSTVIAVSTIANAQFVDLLTFGTSSALPNIGALDAASSNPPFSQDANGVNFSGSFSEGATFYNASSFGPQNLSGVFHIKASSVSTTTPAVPFTFSLFDSGFALIQSFDGVTSGGTLDGGFLYFPITTLPASVTGAEYLQFTFGGAATASSGSLYALSVPEPSTYALMALGGLALFFIARRRKAQV
jgi:hypothetical protein